MSPEFGVPGTRATLLSALAEDLGVTPEALAAGGADALELDVTSTAVVPAGARFEGRVVAREACVVCGLPLLERTFELVDALVARGGDGTGGGDEGVEVFPLVAEGAPVEAGTAIAEVGGPVRRVLLAERTVLDLLAVLCGIATETRRWVEAAAGRVEVCDTRKTIPGLRALSKYAVRVGGGANHRSGLWDMVLVKDNHLAHAGSVTEAVRAARAAHAGLAVEVEADGAAQAAEAARAGVDVVMLDNMDDAAVREAVRAVREASEGREEPVVIEASGGVTIHRLGALADAGVDRVSTSALTLARHVDIGLDA